MTVFLIRSINTVLMTITLGVPIKTVVTQVTGEPVTIIRQVNIIIMIISTLGFICTIITVLVFVTNLNKVYF